MTFNAVSAVSVLVLLVESAFSQCLGTAFPGGAGPFGLAGPVASTAYGPACKAAASTGGGFTVTSVSPIAPTGVSVVSENAIEGALAVGGNLPLLGSVAVEGAFPTAGAGAVSYGCGSGAVGIARKGSIATGSFGSVGPAPALATASFNAGLGYGPGLNGFGFGIGGPCGAV